MTPGFRAPGPAQQACSGPRLLPSPCSYPRLPTRCLRSVTCFQPKVPGLNPALEWRTCPRGEGSQRGPPCMMDAREEPGLSGIGGFLEIEGDSRKTDSHTSTHRS